MAMVGSFAGLPAGAVGVTRECTVSASDSGGLLAAALERVIYRMTPQASFLWASP